MGSWGPNVSSCGQQRLWSDWVDVQADRSLLWAHNQFFGVVMRRLIYYCRIVGLVMARACCVSILFVGLLGTSSVVASSHFNTDVDDTFRSRNAGGYLVQVGWKLWYNVPLKARKPTPFIYTGILKKGSNRIFLLWIGTLFRYLVYPGFTAVKNHVIRYCEKVYEKSGKNLFWPIKNSGEVLNKLKSRGFRATSLSTYDFSTLYITLPHNLIKEKLINLIEWTFKREGSPYIACNERQAFFTSEDTKRYKLWSCQNVCEALIYLLDNIYIRFGTKLYRQIVGIPMGTNCAPLVADLFLFCYERDFMTSLSDVKQAEIIEAFKSTSRYLDDLLNIDNPYFEGMVNRIYQPELQLKKANTSDTEAPFLDLHLSISNGFVSSKIYDKRDDFDFDIVNFPFLDGDVPRSTSYGVYISQLIRFARVSSHVVDFNARNKSLTAKLLQQGYRYHKLRKTFSKFYRRHYELVSKFNVGLKTLLHQGLSEPEFYGDLVYKFKKIVGRVDFSDQFRKIIVRYKRIGYNINIMRQSACLVFNPITVNNFASLFNCTPVGRASDSMMAPT